MLLSAFVNLLLSLASVVEPVAASTAAVPRVGPRITFLGDSLTMGLHASSPEQMYQALLLTRIRGERPGGRVVSIYQDPYGLADDALERLPAVEDSAPDLIILEIGNHEALAGGEEVERFGYRYDELLYRLQLTGASIIAGTLAWLNYPAESREYADALRVNDAIRRLCARRGIAVADLWSATLFRDDLISRPGERSFQPPYDGDDLHPNDAGHRALADAFWHAYQRDRARRILAELHP